MRFIVRFADQIVGALIIGALAALIFVVIMLGSRHRWFARDYHYATYLDSATGLSLNMTVQYKGFTIGNVKSFDLTGENRVQVNFVIYDTYNDRVREGSLVELAVSPLGLGSHFYFYPGRGERLLEENEFIPTVSSPEAHRLQLEGLTEVLDHDDSINLLISRANAVLGNADHIINDLRAALAGDGSGTVGRLLLETEKLVQGAERSVDRLPLVLDKNLAGLLGELEPILADIKSVSGALADPDKLLLSALDEEGFVYTNLESSLTSITEIMGNLDRAAAMMPSELSQVAGLLADLRITLRAADDVLIALSNNPLLRKGIPQPVNTQSGGTGPRDLSF